MPVTVAVAAFVQLHTSTGYDWLHTHALQNYSGLRNCVLAVRCGGAACDQLLLNIPYTCPCQAHGIHANRLHANLHMQYSTNDYCDAACTIRQHDECKYCLVASNPRAVLGLALELQNQGYNEDKQAVLL